MRRAAAIFLSISLAGCASEPARAPDPPSARPNAAGAEEVTILVAGAD